MNPFMVVKYGCKKLQHFKTTVKNIKLLEQKHAQNILLFYFHSMNERTKE